jgi:hypothetical protein
VLRSGEEWLLMLIGLFMLLLDQNLAKFTITTSRGFFEEN